MVTLDARGLIEEYVGVTYVAATTFDGLSPQDYRSILSLPWFSRTAVLADAKSGFERFVDYAWEGACFWGVDNEALGSRMWENIISMEDIDLRYFGSVD